MLGASFPHSVVRFAPGRAIANAPSLASLHALFEHTLAGRAEDIVMQEGSWLCNHTLAGRASYAGGVMVMQAGHTLAGRAGAITVPPAASSSLSITPAAPRYSQGLDTLHRLCCSDTLHEL